MARGCFLGKEIRSVFLPLLSPLPPTPRGIFIVGLAATLAHPFIHSFTHSLILQTRKEDLLSVQFSWAGGGAGPDTPQAVFLSWTGRPHRAMP